MPHTKPKISKEPRISLSEAAKKIGKRRSYLRNLIETGKLPAYCEGGDVKLRFSVRLSEVLQAVEESKRYVPQGLVGRQARSRANKAAKKRT